jgi:hypothetical protein
MKTELTKEERSGLVDGLADWAVRLRIEEFVAFLLEVNRPANVLTGNALIAADPMLRPVLPFSLHDAGLLLQVDCLADDFRARVGVLRATGAPGDHI